MQSGADATRIVRAWLRTGDDLSAAHIVDDVLSIVDATPTTPVTGGLGGRRLAGLAGLVVAAAAVVVVAVVGFDLLPSGGRPGGAPAASPSPDVTPRPTTSPDIVPGTYGTGWEFGRLSVRIPDGWTYPATTLRAVCCSTDLDGPTVTKVESAGSDAILALNLVNDVGDVVADVCAAGEGRLVRVGPTAADLTTALADQVGLKRSGSVDVRVGGYPAKRLVLELPSDGSACPGREDATIWMDPGAAGLVLPRGGKATIYVVDANGGRLVITSVERAALSKDLMERDAMVASIDISGRIVPLPIGRHLLDVDGIPFSFELTTRTENGWADYGGVSINKSVKGPQTAEGIIYWTGVSDGGHTDPCGPLSNLPVGASMADVVDVVAGAPGIELVAGPIDATVGGRPARHVVVTIREDLGCDPGYFYSWLSIMGGPFWLETYAGDTISVWVVDVDGTLLFIAGDVHRDEYPGATGFDVLADADRTRLEQEIQVIVGSIEFGRVAP